MRLERRTLVAAGLGVLLIAGAVLVGLALAGGEDGGPRLAGRIAVRHGCGLTHMWPDGTDRRELCLRDIWSSASLSFDGRRLAWDTNANSAFGILVADADGRNEFVLQLPRGVNVQPSLSGDGKHVAFLHSPRDDGRYDVWSTSTSAVSDVAEQVTAGRNASSPAWSPTGDWIAYVKNWSPLTHEGDMVLVHSDGDGERRLGRGDAPAWAPDGRRLVFERHGDLWVVEADGSKPRLLVEDGRAPAWSRDSRQIAFLREEKCGKAACKQRVFLVFADGDKPRQEGPDFVGATDLLWLPDPNE